MGTQQTKDLPHPPQVDPFTQEDEEKLRRDMSIPNYKPSFEHTVDVYEEMKKCPSTLDYIGTRFRNNIYHLEFVDHIKDEVVNRLIGVWLQRTHEEVLASDSVYGSPIHEVWLRDRELLELFYRYVPRLLIDHKKILQYHGLKTYNELILKYGVKSYGQIVWCCSKWAFPFLSTEIQNEICLLFRGEIAKWCDGEIYYINRFNQPRRSYSGWGPHELLLQYCFDKTPMVYLPDFTSNCSPLWVDSPLSSPYFNKLTVHKVITYHENERINYLLNIRQDWTKILCGVPLTVIYSAAEMLDMSPYYTISHQVQTDEYHKWFWMFHGCCDIHRYPTHVKDRIVEIFKERKTLYYYWRHKVERVINCYFHFK